MSAANVNWLKDPSRKSINFKEDQQHNNVLMFVSKYGLISSAKYLLELKEFDFAGSSEDTNSALLQALRVGNFSDVY